MRVSSLARERQNKLLADARAHAADASKAKAAFWLALQSPTRDLDALFKLALVIQENIDGAERAFRDLFALGRSGAVLRMYASFLLYAANEPAKVRARRCAALFVRVCTPRFYSLYRPRLSSRRQLLLTRRMAKTPALTYRTMARCASWIRARSNHRIMRCVSVLRTSTSFTIEALSSHAGRRYD